jgi:hypothetical protein
MSDKIMHSDSIEDALVRYFLRYRSSTKWWSLCLYSALFGAAALSAAAGILPQLSPSTKDVATVLAVSAALVNTINGIGRFDQKWQASRVARAETERLHILWLENQNAYEVGRQLEQVIIDQSAGVIGSHAPLSSGPRAAPEPEHGER